MNRRNMMAMMIALVLTAAVPGAQAVTTGGCVIDPIPQVEKSGPTIIDGADCFLTVGGCDGY